MRRDHAAQAAAHATEFIGPWLHGYARCMGECRAARPIVAAFGHVSLFRQHRFMCNCTLYLCRMEYVVV
jgi:hypothetical protein